MENYNDIYTRMKEKYEQLSDDKIDEASDIAIRMKVLAGEIYNAQVYSDWLKRQMFVSTSEGEFLNYQAVQRGLSRKYATKAEGEIGFYINEVRDTAVIIPKGTVVATSDEIPVRFVITDDGEISAGNTLVYLSAQAQEGGKAGNISPNTANVSVSVPSDVDYVTNVYAFSGGSDEETDDELRQRIEETFASPSNGTNISYYNQLALSVDGITKVSVAGKYRGTGTVDVFVCGNGELVDEETIQKAQSLLSSNRELNVDVKVNSASLKSVNLNVTVTAKDGYESTVVKALCKEAFEKYISSLNIGDTMYLSAIGGYLMNTGCINSYAFDGLMSDFQASRSQCMIVGNVLVEVI